MKYNRNANIELKTGRNRSYTRIHRDEDKVEADILVSDQYPQKILEDPKVSKRIAMDGDFTCVTSVISAKTSTREPPNHS